jgi:hypothetical protein
MRVHYVLNHGGTPQSKLADVEIFFEEGLLAGMKLVGCSVWRAKKGEKPTILVPSRSYATAAGVRYYELLRAAAPDSDSEKKVVKGFKEYIREEYMKIAELPDGKEPN